MLKKLSYVSGKVLLRYIIFRLSFSRCSNPSKMSCFDSESSPSTFIATKDLLTAL